MQSPDKLREIIDREIEKMAFATRRPSELYLPVHYIMSNGGKRLRSLLSLMACQLFSDKLTPCIKPAIAIELFHNFTLLHDDIMDKSEMRRGKPTVHKKWNVNTAILSGDAMVVISFDLISSADREIMPRLLSVFNKTAIEVCEGQQMDINFENQSRINEQTYLGMIKLKTSVLIAAALEIGAIAGGSSDSDASLMYESGVNMGLGFQLQDDLLDLYGKQEKFGKKPGGDILMNKKTFLLVKALENADENTVEKIIHLMKMEKNPETKVREIKKIFDQLDIQTITNEIVETYFKSAIERLEKTTPGKERKDELIGFIKTIMKRKS